MDLIWLISLLITHVVAYFIGKGDGHLETDREVEAFEAVKKYEIDKQFEHMRWLTERKEKLCQQRFMMVSKLNIWILYL